jgi:hypothetical protein
MAEADAHDTAARDIFVIATRLLDGVYMAWRQAQHESHDALRAWLDSGSCDHAAYCAYRAALDREEAAAVDLERLSQLAEAA